MDVYLEAVCYSMNRIHGKHAFTQVSVLEGGGEAEMLCRKESVMPTWSEQVGRLLSVRRERKG